MPISRKPRPIPKQDKDSHLPRAAVGGRFVTQYDAGLALEIVEMLAEGQTLNSILRDKPGMPHPTTFRRWQVNNPDLAKAVDVALRVSASSLEEEALDMARKIALMPKDGTHVRAAEVKIKQLQWSAERRDPAKFGTRTQVNIKVPVQIVTPLDLGNVGGDVSIPDIYNLQASRARPIEAIEQQPLLEEMPITKGHRKVVLTPFNAALEKVSSDGQGRDVRSEGDQRGDGAGLSGPGYEEFHIPSSEEEPSPEEGGGGPDEDTEDGGED